MKKIFCVSVFTATIAYGQQGNANINNSPITLQSLMGRSGYVEPIETMGTPYLYVEYKKASIANNQKLVDMRYNAYTDEVDIINNGQKMTIFKRPEYSPIHIIDSDETLWLMDYPYKGKTVKGYLFEVKKINGITLFLRLSKSYEKGKYATDSFDRSKENLYTYLPDVFYIRNIDDEIFQLPKTRDLLIKLFPDKKNKIETEFKDNKLDITQSTFFSKLFRILE